MEVAHTQFDWPSSQTKGTREAQKDKTEAKRDYEAMEYSLAYARQEVTAALFILKDIISEKEAK